MPAKSAAATLRKPVARDSVVDWFFHQSLWNRNCR